MAYVSRTDSLRRAEGQERHQSPAARCEEWPAQTGVIPAIGQRPAESARDRFAEYREPIPECGHWGTPEPYAVRSVRYDARGFTFRSMTPGWRAGVVGGARSRHAPCKTTKIPRGVAECLRDCLGQRSAIGRSAAHSLSPRIERPVLSTLRCTPLPVGTRGWYGAYPTTHGSPLPMNHRSRCVLIALPLADFCLSGCFNKPQHVAINPSEPRRRERPECVGKAWGRVPSRDRATSERRPSVAADDCGEIRTRPSKPEVAPC